MKLAWLILLAAVLLALASCSSDTKPIRFMIQESPKLRMVQYEEGYQLWWGGRTQAMRQSDSDTSASQVNTIDKAEMGLTGRTLIGSYFGWKVGGPTGAAVGGGAGLASGLVERTVAK